MVSTFTQFLILGFRAVPSRTLRPCVTSPVSRHSADAEFRSTSPDITPLRRLCGWLLTEKIPLSRHYALSETAALTAAAFSPIVPDDVTETD